MLIYTMFDYKLIEALSMVAREGGFDKAARALYITQSAVSQRVKLLEELTDRFTLIEVNPVEGRGVLLEYLAKVEGSGVEGAVMDRLNGAPDGVVTAAELRSLRGLKKFS